MTPVTEALVLWLAFAAGWVAIAAANLALQPSRPPVRFTWWGAIVWLVVAIPSVLQFVVPGLLELGMRNGDILRHGEWWRIVTGNVLQDGGVAGTVSNLAVLAVTLLLVGRALPGGVAIALFVVGGVGSMLLQLAHPGAGNSMATLALVAAAAVIVTARKGVRVVSIVGTVVVAAIGVALTETGNEHGPALLLGLLLGALCLLVLAPLRRPAAASARADS